MTIKPFHLLIPAAGSGTRFGDNTPKQYYKIQGKTVLRHTIEKFFGMPGLQSITVLINEEHRALYDEAVKGLDINVPITGSKSRKSSIYNGLKFFIKVKNGDIILIHDAARPLISVKDITKLLDSMEENQAATLACPVSDTLLRGNKTVNREALWSIQTPQAFDLKHLIKAHEKFADDDSFTDDTGLMRAMGHEVALITGSRANIKITTQEDLIMAETFIANTLKTRTTSGFDVHAFEITPSERKLMLGGLEIPHDVALTGHSDADVVLHAITDAILGGINKGDIGTHFPPSDPQWKDADSAFFLQEAHKMLKNAGGALQFIDVTIMAEAPKIGPHRAAIQTCISEILKLPETLISIKATTTEGLGFTGRKEGIACQALVTIEIPQN